MLLCTRIQSSPLRHIWRSRSWVISCIFLHKIHEMELFRLSDLDTLWKRHWRWVSFSRMRRWCRKMSPKQWQWQRLFVVVLCWCFATSCHIIHYISYPILKRSYFCLVWHPRLLFTDNFQWQLFLTILFHSQAEACHSLKCQFFQDEAECMPANDAMVINGILHLFSEFLQDFQDNETDELQKDACDARALVS